MVRGPYEALKGEFSPSQLMTTEPGSMSASHVCIVPLQQTGFSSMLSLVSTACHASGYGGSGNAIGEYLVSVVLLISVVLLGGKNGGILVQGTHVHCSPVAYSPTGQWDSHRTQLLLASRDKGNFGRLERLELSCVLLKVSLSAAKRYGRTQCMWHGSSPPCHSKADASSIPPSTSNGHGHCSQKNPPALFTGRQACEHTRGQSPRISRSWPVIVEPGFSRHCMSCVLSVSVHGTAVKKPGPAAKMSSCAVQHCLQY